MVQKNKYRGANTAYFCGKLPTVATEEEQYGFNIEVEEIEGFKGPWYRATWSLKWGYSMDTHGWAYSMDDEFNEPRKPQ